ncbi:glycosyl hydrolase [Cyclobacterium salsum]|uniref:glycosyl hydrolase n=1 Tax=Cyclobacterium salsum TaxID=2666329 RepID=UPI001391C311|nr:glycosyl hydrolase [Cyclobacterium salsum]
MIARKLIIAFALVFSSISLIGQSLEESFRTPPDSVKPWVFWFWINGNISQEGITKDLEAMKEVGINGVIWMEVSGPWWAPEGKIEAGSAAWHEAMQWAITEADRLEMEFALTVDFGYGAGGPHITPDISIQKLVWSQTEVQGGKKLNLQIEKPKIDKTLEPVWLRPGQEMNPEVTNAVDSIDSYRDISVFAIPTAKLKKSTLIPENEKEKIAEKLRNVPGLKDVQNDPLMAWDGRGWKTHLPPMAFNAELSALQEAETINLSEHMDANGKLVWDTPEGDWTIVRLGYASNYHITRPSPRLAVGLESDRLHPRGINTHFEHRLQPIIEAAGEKAGRTLKYIHIDSWEAGGQNWTLGFEEEFRKRRGYSITPWLPVLTGHAVDNRQKTEGFLWDLRKTVSEVTLDNYIVRLKELIAPYGMKNSNEPYGRIGINSLEYATNSDFMIAEFWTEREIIDKFPTFSDYWYHSMKGLASVANTYGKTRVGAEAFTGSRGWVDHPYLIKGMGDEAFGQGINHYIYHLYAHQAYDNMKPGLTHRRWGQHINRYQTWWNMSKPYFDYVARCQALLQKGRRVVDVAYMYYEGAPLNFNNINFSLPFGYDYDFCTSETIERMTVRDGIIHLPNGVSYNYLVLPSSDRLSLPLIRTVQTLKKAGANVYLQQPVAGTPGLEGYPEADQQVKAIAENWKILPEGGWESVFSSDKTLPDFEGDSLRWIHRQTDENEFYFVANTKPEEMRRTCIFRTKKKVVELWNPETGEIFKIETTQRKDGRTEVDLQFEPSQSWFIVFKDKPSNQIAVKRPFMEWEAVKEIVGTWDLEFDKDWGPAEKQTFGELKSWSESSNELVKYYSGTATYRKEFNISDATIKRLKEIKGSTVGLDLGRVEVVAKIKLNGEDCGIVWKPPFRVDITKAIKTGTNKLEIEVVNTWVNRMIGDEQLPLDAEWKDWETLVEWPDWFKQGEKSPTGRYTFTTARHYQKDSPLMPSGLLGPVRIMSGK